MLLQQKQNIKRQNETIASREKLILLSNNEKHN